MSKFYKVIPGLRPVEYEDVVPFGKFNLCQPCCLTDGTYCFNCDSKWVQVQVVGGTHFVAGCFTFRECVMPGSLTGIFPYPSLFIVGPSIVSSQFTVSSGTITYSIILRNTALDGSYYQLIWSKVVPDFCSTITLNDTNCTTTGDGTILTINLVDQEVFDISGSYPCGTLTGTLSGFVNQPGYNVSLNFVGSSTGASGLGKLKLEAADSNFGACGIPIASLSAVTNPILLIVVYIQPICNPDKYIAYAGITYGCGAFGSVYSEFAYTIFSDADTSITLNFSHMATNFYPCVSMPESSIVLTLAVP